MVHDSEDILDAFAIVVWLVVLMLLLVAMALPCHSLDVMYGNEPSDVINVVPAS
jgi:sensor histidine kinase regulating citrate/malate metabolism